MFVYEFVKKDTRTLLKLGHAANYLQLEGAVDTICDALAQNIGNNSGDVKKDFIKYFEKCAKVLFFTCTHHVKYVFSDDMSPLPFLC